MSDKEYTYSDIKSHDKKADLYVVIHDKVYNVSTFIDEHPGGEEVMLDVGGQDATEAFEDVGHSDEAREILEGLLIGNLKRQPGDPEPKAQTKPVTSMNKTADSVGGFGSGLYLILIMGALLAAAAFYVTQLGSK